jgi:hypothetical protein
MSILIIMILTIFHIRLLKQMNKLILIKVFIITMKNHKLNQNHKLICFRVKRKEVNNKLLKLKIFSSCLGRIVTDRMHILKLLNHLWKKTQSLIIFHLNQSYPKIMFLMKNHLLLVL